MVLDGLLQFDRSVFLALNGLNNDFFDMFFSLFTSKEIWYPFYVILAILIVRKYKKSSFWIILLLALVIVASDQISGVIKHLVERPRPTHEPLLAGLVHNTFVGPGGSYGFPSSHAANAFALFVFISFLFRERNVTISLFLWAILTAYSRIYVGVHYPLDILCGTILGCLLGWGAFKLLIAVDLNYGRKGISQERMNPKFPTNFAIFYTLLLFVIVLFVVSIVLLKYF